MCSRFSFHAFVLVLTGTLLVFASCKKSPETVGISAVTGDAIEISHNSALLTGRAVFPASPSADVSIGVHYSLSEGMLVSNSTELIAMSFDKNFSFSLSVGGLEPDTKYYYRTFVKDAGGYIFGEIESFVTAKAPSLKLSKNSVSLDFRTQSGTFDVTIENPAPGCTLNASSQAQWITDVTVTGNTVSYNVAENLSGEDRSSSITLSYGVLEDSFNITQTSTTLSLPVYSINTDYTAKSLSFTYSISNPVEGIDISASTTDSWISEVKISGTSVSYKVAENSGSDSRTGKISLTYSVIKKEFSVIQGRSQLINGHEFVDLGLSVAWATCNVGATNPENYGAYYQWAGIQDVANQSIYLSTSNCPYHSGSSVTTGWTKYVQSGKSSYWSGSGVDPDNKTVLDLVDDAARARWGGSWRMPTGAEWGELQSNCTWTWTSMNGIPGYKVQSKKSGYTDKWIFLPSGGYRRNGSLDDNGSAGWYWSSSLSSIDPYSAICVAFSSKVLNRIDSQRWDGHSVRPVSK